MQAKILKPESKKKFKEFEVRVTVNNQIILDPNEPVPVNFNGNSFRYAGNKKYIPFLGSDDNLVNTLMEARLSSATQNACIGSIAQSLVGNGLAVKDVETPDEDFTNWAKIVNRDKETLDEVLVGVIDGERSFGNQFIEVIRGSVGSKKYLRICPQSLLFCRLANPEPQDNQNLDYVVISKQIAKQGYVNLSSDVKRIPIWNSNPLLKNDVWLKDTDGTERTMIHFKNKISGIENYGLPASIASLRYQILESKAAQYNIDNFDNNMVLGGMLIFKASMTTEEAQAQAQEILLTHVGNGKTGRIAVVSSEGGMDDVTFIPYNTQKEGSYIEFDKRVEEKIVASNMWDSVLAGINRSSTFGNGSQYIRSIWDVKDAVLLHPLRNKLISKVINPIRDIWADWYSKPEVAKYQFKLQTNMPFSFMGDLDPNTFFMVKEARAKAGLPVDLKIGDKYLSEMGGNSNNQQASTASESNTTPKDTQNNKGD